MQIGNSYANLGNINSNFNTPPVQNQNGSGDFAVEDRGDQNIVEDNGFKSQTIQNETTLQQTTQNRDLNNASIQSRVNIDDTQMMLQRFQQQQNFINGMEAYRQNALM